ncbi:rhamnogalacturonan acetylesterase [Flavisolibacter sp. BT320]|nr:rhamnogalacturonan acetylesterase [Flavisolibacter longurius]
MKRTLLSTLVAVFLLASSFTFFQKEKPVLYIIGDSTVRNGNGTGENQQWGWGSFIVGYFDTGRISVENHAIGGRSSRTFLTEGRWEKILQNLKKGDYVIMQFGHNDGGPLDDTARARGSIRGIGEESKAIYNPIRKKEEVVYTYGWYLRNYIRDAKAKGAIPVVCSPIPRNQWREGKVVRSADSYSGWAAQVAKEEGAPFIDLNEIVAARYEAMGTDAVKAFFPVDHTHTNREGAQLNAQILVDAIKELNGTNLKQYLH